MKTIMLGKNGPQVSRIGLGCVGMSDLYGSKETRNAKEIIATIDTAVEQGINFFDTGDYYGMGHNELLLREAMRGRRDKFFIFGSSLAYLTSIDKVEDGGQTIYGRFHSDQWGDFKTFLRFHIENGKITKMDVGQTDY